MRADDRPGRWTRDEAVIQHLYAVLQRRIASLSPFPLGFVYAGSGDNERSRLTPPAYTDVNRTSPYVVDRAKSARPSRLRSIWDSRLKPEQLDVDSHGRI